VFAADTENVGAIHDGPAKAAVPVFVTTEKNLHDDKTDKIPPPLFKDITSAPLPLLDANHAMSAAFNAAAPASVLAYGKEKPGTVFKLTLTPVGLTTFIFK
jgi:hypothetical protein